MHRIAEKIAGESPRVTIILDATIRSPVPGFSRCFRGPRREEVLEILEKTFKKKIPWNMLQGYVFTKENRAFCRLFADMIDWDRLGIYSDDPFMYMIHFREARDAAIMKQFRGTFREEYSFRFIEPALWDEKTAKSLRNDGMLPVTGPCRPGFIRDFPQYTPSWFDFAGQTAEDIVNIVKNKLDFRHIPYDLLDSVADYLKLETILDIISFRDVPDSILRRVINFGSDYYGITGVVIERPLCVRNMIKYLAAHRNYFRILVSSPMIIDDFAANRAYIDIGNSRCAIPDLNHNGILDITQCELPNDVSGLDWYNIGKSLYYSGKLEYIDRHFDKIPLECAQYASDAIVGEYLVNRGYSPIFLEIVRADCPEKCRLILDAIAIFPYTRWYGEHDAPIVYYLQRFALRLADRRPPLYNMLMEETCDVLPENY